jgi:hypothetical protein
VKISPEELPHLVRIQDCFSPENDEKYPNRFPTNIRKFYFLARETRDRSFLTLGAGIKIQGQWYLNMAGAVRYLNYHHEKTVRAYAA